MSLHRQGLVKKQRLTEQELLHIQALTRRSEDAEGIHLRLDWSMLKNRSTLIPLDFLFYQDDTLVGYLALDNHGDEVNELTGTIHPSYRRQGIFTKLLQAATAESRQVGARRLVLVSDKASPSAQAFIHVIRASYDISEHEMILTHFQPRQAFDDRLSVRQATMRDVEAIALVQAESFQQPLERTRRRADYWLQQPTCQLYLATFGEESVNCGEPVASLRVMHNEYEPGRYASGIYGFGVRPAYQRRGYGRQLLEEVILMLQKQSTHAIILDVDTDNTHAFALYSSCGFETRATYDYYYIDIAQ